MLQSILLEEDECVIGNIMNTVLLGKILAKRLFKKLTIKEIVTTTWWFKGKVLIEMLNKNVFKFTFTLREDKDLIYQNRP